MIFCILGRSSSGKSAIYNMISKSMPWLEKYIEYTTRPMREGEIQNQTYNFVTIDELTSLNLISDQVFHTANGDWHYAIADDISSTDNILMITNVHSYKNMVDYYGGDMVKGILISAPDDYELLLRAIDRERKQSNPNYKELCRRFIADSDDVEKFYNDYKDSIVEYVNDDLYDCCSDVMEYIERTCGKYVQ